MKKVLVPLTERKWIAENAVKEMGKEVISKVIDLDKYIERIRAKRKANNLSPYIEIQPISPDQHKSPNKLPTFQKDPKYGVLYGIALSADPFGNIKWQKYQLGDMLSLNLDNENDAKIWAVMQFNPDIQGSPFQNDAPYYKIYDPVDEAMEEHQESLQMEQAFERVRKISSEPKQMVQFARYMGEEVMDNTNFEIVRGALLKFARHDAKRFNKRWENRARSFAEHFYSALALGVIEENVDGGYTFGNITLGLSKVEAVKFLAKDTTVMNSINTALETKDKAVLEVKKTIPKAGEDQKKDGKLDEDLE